jgi:hypothetical protein
MNHPHRPSASQMHQQRASEEPRPAPAPEPPPPAEEPPPAPTPQTPETPETPETPPAAQPTAHPRAGPHNATVGTAGGTTAIVVDMYVLASAVPVKVHLSQSYTTAQPPGYPSRPSMTGAAQHNVDYPQTIASGTTLALLPVEAAALVAAGAATYV